MNEHEKFMKAALRFAERAAQNDEVPIGAVIVKDGKIVARAANDRNHSKNAVSHAEIAAIVKACKKLGDWRLVGCRLYVTLEPCLMCIGACYNARISEVYFGAYDRNGGGATTVVDDFRNNTLNHNLTLVGGILKDDCSKMLTDYFRSKRQ